MGVFVSQFGPVAIGELTQPNCVLGSEVDLDVLKRQLPDTIVRVDKHTGILSYHQLRLALSEIHVANGISSIHCFRLYLVIFFETAQCRGVSMAGPAFRGGATHSSSIDRGSDSHYP